MNEDIFDPAEIVDPNLVPEGTYDLRIRNASIQPTKKGTGRMVVIETEVASGSQENRRLWIRLNIQNDNEVAQNIGRAQFKQFLTAVEHEGKFDLTNDFAKLDGKLFSAMVTIEGGYNAVKNFKKTDVIPF